MFRSYTAEGRGESEYGGKQERSVPAKRYSSNGSSSSSEINSAPNSRAAVRTHVFRWGSTCLETRSMHSLLFTLTTSPCLDRHRPKQQYACLPASQTSLAAAADATPLLRFAISLSYTTSLRGIDALNSFLDSNCRRLFNLPSLRLPARRRQRCCLQ